jgi:hypothetical protein
MSSSENPKGSVPRACTSVNVKGKLFLRFENHIYAALGQAKLEWQRTMSLLVGDYKSERVLVYLKGNY